MRLIRLLESEFHKWSINNMILYSDIDDSCSSRGISYPASKLSSIIKVNNTTYRIEILVASNHECKVKYRQDGRCLGFVKSDNFGEPYIYSIKVNGKERLSNPISFEYMNPNRIDSLLDFNLKIPDKVYNKVSHYCNSK